MKQPIVVVESPYKAATTEELELNLAYARAALKDCLLRGEAPFASHLLYTQPGVLRDHEPVERKLGIDAGFAFKRVAEKTVVYIDLGVSEGMQKGIDAAVQAGLNVETRSLPAWADKHVTDEEAA